MGALKMTEQQPDADEHRAYSADEKLELLARYERELAAGKTQRELCDELGVKRSTIMYWRVQLERGEELSDGIARNPDRKPRVEHALSTKQDAVRMYARGKHTVAQVAAKYNVNQSTISKWVADDRAGQLRSRIAESAPAPPKTPPPPLPQHAPKHAPAPHALEVEVQQLRAENDRLKAVIMTLMGRSH